MTIKQLGKAFLSRCLEAQVKRLKAKNDFKIIAVVGSVGKTTTKLAIAKMLEPSMRVQYQNGNYNDRLTAPLVVFGQTEPSIFNIPAWLRLLKSNWAIIKKPYPYDVLVVELGSDGPGQIADFKYMQPDIAVVTALTDEHMEYFKTLEAVAKEELTVLQFAEQTIVNVDDSPAQYLKDLQYQSYGFQSSDHPIVTVSSESTGQQVIRVTLGHSETVDLSTSLLGAQGAKSVAAAAIVASKCGLTKEQIAKNVNQITAVPGRMQLLNGISNSVVIDDSYNASPVAMKAALDTLYNMPVQQRIALLGNMNEMGDLSPSMHTEIGNYCDPLKLAFVVTLGPDANTYLAPAAAAKGCVVKSFDSPYLAGEFIKQQLMPSAAVLVKGSQNRVFSEEAIKALLADPVDASKLARQSARWMEIKQQQFKS